MVWCGSPEIVVVLVVVVIAAVVVVACVVLAVVVIWFGVVLPKSSLQSVSWSLL
jgi:Mg2+/Co2+ transporter CorB